MNFSLLQRSNKKTRKVKISGIPKVLLLSSLFCILGLQNEVKASRMLFNKDPNHTSRHEMNQPSTKLNTSMFDNIIQNNINNKGADYTDSIRKQFPFLKNSNIRDCNDIKYSRKPSDNPVKDFPEIISTYICSPNASILLFHVKEQGSEALYVIDGYNLSQHVDLHGTSKSISKQYYFLKENIQDDTVFFWTKNSTWSNLLLNLLSTRDSGESSPLEDYGLSEVKWCDSICLQKLAAKLKENGIKISRNNLIETTTTGMVVILRIREGSEASKIDCLKSPNLIVQTADYKPFDSVNDFNKYFYSNYAVVGGKPKFKGRIDVIELANLSTSISLCSP